MGTGIVTRLQRKRRQSQIITLVLVVIIVGWRLYTTEPDVEVTQEAEFADVEVQRVVDGDTLLLADRTRVRLLGIDTPETKKEGTPVEPFGPEATEFTKQFIGGKTVRLEFDRERFDDYGRVLAFVFVDGVMLNEQLVENGLATAELQYPFRSDYKRRLADAEKFAQSERIGIWSIPTINANDHR